MPTTPKGFYAEALLGSDGTLFKSPLPGSLRLVQTGAGFAGTPMTVYTDALGSNPDPTGAAHTDAAGNLRAYLDPDVGHFDIYTSTGLLFAADLGVPVAYTPTPSVNPNAITTSARVTAAATLVAGQETEFTVTAAAAATVPTPSVASLFGVKNSASSTAAVTVTPPASWTIDGQPTFVMQPTFDIKLRWAGAGTNLDVE